MHKRLSYLLSISTLLLLYGCAIGQTQAPPSFPTDPVPSVTPAMTASLTPTPVIEISPEIPGNWKLVWSDEFEGTQLDTSRWTTCYWWADTGCTIISNNELEWYQPGNVTVQNGKLILEAREQQVEGLNGEIYPYTSGMVSSGRSSSELTESPRFSFQYGYVEMRAKIPAGQGIWPAFWMLPLTHVSRPEIDIMEILGHEPDTVKFYYHYVDSEGDRADSGGEWVGPDFSEDWHTFGVDWQPDRITWYVDGVQRFEFTDTSAISSEPMYILLNLAVGGDWPGAPDESTMFPSQYMIDYVRVFQRHE